MEDFVTAETLVEEVLTQYPETRGNDALLYICICKLINPSVVKMKYEDVMLESSNLGLPNYDTISRARRKLQAKYKELKADRKTSERRYARWKIFREYAQE